MDCERYQREVSQLGRELADLRAQLARIPLVEEENRKLAKALGEAQDAQVRSKSAGLVTPLLARNGSL